MFHGVHRWADAVEEDRPCRKCCECLGKIKRVPEGVGGVGNNHTIPWLENDTELVCCWPVHPVFAEVVVDKRASEPTIQVIGVRPDLLLLFSEFLLTELYGVSVDNRFSSISIISSR